MKILRLLQKVFSNCDLLEKNCENVLLYARRDKNNPKFDIAMGELLQFLGIICCLVTTVYHLSKIFGPSA